MCVCVFSLCAVRPLAADKLTRAKQPINSFGLPLWSSPCSSLSLRNHSCQLTPSNASYLSWPENCPPTHPSVYRVLDCSFFPYMTFSAGYLKTLKSQKKNENLTSQICANLTSLSAGLSYICVDPHLPAGLSCELVQYLTLHTANKEAVSRNLISLRALHGQVALCLSASHLDKAKLPPLHKIGHKGKE